MTSETLLKVGTIVCALCMVAPLSALAGGKGITPPKPKPKPKPATVTQALALECKEFEDAAKTAFTDGAFATALKQAEAAMKCNGKNNMSMIAGMAACASTNADKARYWFKFIPRTKQDQLLSFCLRQKVMIDPSSVPPTPVAAPALKAAPKATPLPQKRP